MSGHGSDDENAGGSGYETDGSSGEAAEVRRERKERVGLQAAEAQRDREGGLEEGSRAIENVNGKLGKLALAEANTQSDAAVIVDAPPPTDTDYSEHATPAPSPFASSLDLAKVGRE